MPSSKPSAFGRVRWARNIRCEMQATKYSVNINVEALSLDSVPALVMEAVDQMDTNESMAGTVIKDDGDTVDWTVRKKEVEF